MKADLMNFTGCGGYITKPESGARPVLSVLYVDDEPNFLNVCKLYLERRPDISVSLAGSVENALKLLATSTFDVIISDYQMPGTNGIGFLKILNEKRCSIPFILFTVWGQEEVMTETISYRAVYYLQKSGNPRSLFTELEDKIREACRLHKTEGTVPDTGLSYPAAH
jgi:DNA-binding NtrC family response regulator